MEAWIYLVILAIFCFILEIFIPAFIALSVGAGLLAAMAGMLFGLGAGWLFVLFIWGVLIAFFLLKPLMLRAGYRRNLLNRSKHNSLIGKTGLVVEEIPGAVIPGRIKIDGDVWPAVSTNGSTIAANTLAVVDGTDSIILIVKPLIS
ncbi:MAG: NfeD family protein [Bacteroidetes bacterium]|nr:NfeD family protein [Bacteroidota bacterium]